MRYLIIALLLITTSAYATTFVKDNITYHREKQKDIKQKLRSKFYKHGVEKKLKLKEDKTGWEVVDY